LRSAVRAWRSGAFNAAVAGCRSFRGGLEEAIMRLNRLDLNLLIYLDALLEEKSVSRAADRVFITQPSMSEALARLRSYFQDDLLVQIGKVMVPTPLAESLVQPVRDILIQIQSVTSATVMDFDPAKSRRKLTVMATDYGVDVVLNRVLPRMWRQAPGMQVEFMTFAADYQQHFERGNIDLVLVPQAYTSEAHPSELLFEETFTCVVWSKNPLVGNSVSFEQYKKLGHVCVNLGEWRIPTYDEWFLKRYGDLRRIEVVVPAFGMAMQVVQGTHRILTCHQRHAKMHAKRYSLRLVKPPFEIPPFKFRMQWHKHRDRDPALIWFRGLLKAVASEV
jgi:LysR family nod box-dependent transcriptional activator